MDGSTIPPFRSAYLPTRAGGDDGYAGKRSPPHVASWVAGDALTSKGDEGGEQRQGKRPFGAAAIDAAGTHVPESDSDVGGGGDACDRSGSGRNVSRGYFSPDARSAR
jgi:hypothetical protein